MRVLLGGDTHGEISQCHWLGQQAVRYGCHAVFILGDFGFWEHEPDGEDFLDDVADIAAQTKKPWYALDGNHDKTSLILDRYSNDVDDEGFLSIRPGLKYAPRGHRWTWDNTRFISLGGAYSVDKGYRLQVEAIKAARIRRRNQYRPVNRRRSPDTSGTMWFPEEEMTDEDMAKILTDTTPVNVILAHDKPRGSNPDWNRKDLLECLPNQDRLQMAVTTLRPQFFIHGHLHYRYSDRVAVDAHTWCQVEGLDCDPRGHGVALYNRDDSFIWLDTGGGLPTVGSPCLVD